MTGDVAAPGGGATEPSRPSWTYEATVAVGAEAIAVRMCFADTPPAALRPLVDDAVDVVDALGVEGRDAGLNFADGTVSLRGVRPGECVRWRVDLRAGAEGGRGRALSWVGDSVLVRQSMWLLWPTDAPGDVRPTLTLHTPQGVRASVPWPLLDGDRDGPEATYALDTTVARWLGYTAFGALAIDRFERAGAAVEIVRLDEPIACDPDGVRRWITDALDGAAMLYGRYPRDRLQVIVVPTDGNDGTVYFGAAARGGGSGVYLLLDTEAQAERLPGGWTTVHEFLHHGMPFVADAWMSEGFVSYYTEVMRTRQGHRSEAEGWRELWDAFERGRRSGRGMSLERTSANMHETFAYQRVYWGGAAIAFDLDVTLRLESGGKLGFDDAMKHLRDCCGDARFQYRADALLAILDEWYGAPLFTTVARKHLRDRDFADIEAIYARLGMRHTGVSVEIDPDHPGAAARAAIMRGTPSSGSSRAR